MAEEKFVFDSLQDNVTIKDFLNSLTEGFEKGSITLSTNGDEIVLNPQGLLNFTVKAKKKGLENRLSVKVTWKDNPVSKPLEASALKVG
jgi:amphi-Trp domain-containing protein